MRGLAFTHFVRRNTILWGIVGCVLLFLLPQAAVSDSGAVRSKFAGVYLSHGGKTDPSINLSLGADGTATVVEDPGNGAITRFGHWVDSGSQVTITFNAEEGKAADPPMVFAPCPGGLQAVTWNRAAWGRVTPPAMKKGYKVKDKYWFTTIR